jgi:hypothetical protein
MSGVGRRLGIAVCVALVCCAACSSSTSSTASTTPASAQTIPPRHPLAAHMLPGGFSTSIELPATTLITGGSVQGRVVVHNPGRALYVGGCDGFKVVLVSDTVHPRPTWHACYRVFAIPHGTSSYPATVYAAWCWQTMGLHEGAVACAAGRRAPPLSPGTYQATLLTDMSPSPTAPTVRVRVVSEASQQLGSVIVTLAAIGGPAPGSPRPLPGTIVLRNESTSFMRSVGRNGSVTLSVPPGTYTATGHSPLYFIDGNQGLCRAEQPVTVQPLRHPPNCARVSVYCQEM